MINLNDHLKYFKKRQKIYDLHKNKVIDQSKEILVTYVWRFNN